MNKSLSQKLVYTSSDSESGEIEFPTRFEFVLFTNFAARFLPGEEIVPKKDSESGEDDSASDFGRLISTIKEESYVLFPSEGGDDAITSSTQIVQNNTVPEEKSVKLALAEAIRKINHSTASATTGIKKINWDKIAIEGHTTAELQAELHEIIKLVPRTRTLDEILADYLKNHSRYSLNSHPDFPKKPMTPYFMYITENRDKLKKLMEQENPGKHTNVSSSSSKLRSPSVIHEKIPNFSLSSCISPTASSKVSLTRRRRNTSDGTRRGTRPGQRPKKSSSKSIPK